MSVGVYVCRTQTALRHAHSGCPETTVTLKLTEKTVSRVKILATLKVELSSQLTRLLEARSSQDPARGPGSPPFWDTGSTGARSYPPCPVRRRTDPTTSQKESLESTQHLNIQLSTDGLTMVSALPPTHFVNE